MKSLPIKQIEIKLDGDQKASYVQLIKHVLNQMPEKGFSAEEMRERIKIMDKIENMKEGDTLQLEDAEAKKLKDLCRVTRWGAIHKDFIAFDKDVTDMEAGKFDEPEEKKV